MGPVLPQRDTSVGQETMPAQTARSLSPSDPDATEIAARYARDGYVFPFALLDPAEAMTAGERAIDIHRQGGEVKSLLFSQAQLAFPFVDALANDPRILDAVETIMGPDLLLWSAGFFFKEPQSPHYISWHQDLTYWGLDSTEEITVWLALSPVTEASGCMRFIPGSHHREIVPHRDTFADENLLSRGQEIAVEVDEAAAIPVCLEPGQFSLHHGRMFHASGPNSTDGWRVGLAMRYITPAMRQVVGHKDFAQLVRGEDRYGHFELMPRPKREFDPEGIALFKRVIEIQHEFFYKDAAQGPRN